MLYIFAFVVSLVVTMVLIPPIMKWADKIGAIDIPDARKVHTQAIPRVGGIAMVAGSVISIFLLADLNQQVLAILTGFLIIWAFGLWDDKCDLNYKTKFLGQLLAVIVVVTWGDVVVRSFPFVDGYLPGYIAIPFTIFALVGITNAINLSDGLDGLAGGTSLISISIIALLAFDANGNGEIVVLISMAVAGSILGFLRHNTYPARLFMGDTGSQFLGFSLGVLVIVLSQSINSAMSPITPLFILGLPILDTIAVMGQRIYERRSPFSADKNHIHHKLLGLGFDHYEAVFIIYIVQTLLIAAAYFLLYELDAVLTFMYIVISVIVLAVFHFAEASQWKFHRNEAGRASVIRLLVDELQGKGWLTVVPGHVLKLIVPTLLLLSAIFTTQVPKDMAILAFLLLLFLLISLFVNKNNRGLLEKAVVYIVSVMAIYMLPVGGVNSAFSNIINILFILLVLSFVLRTRFSYEKTFQITPLDYLVIILVIIVPNLPEVHLEDSGIGEMAVKLVILFYASEAIMGLSFKRFDFLRMGSLMALTIMVLRGI